MIDLSLKKLSIASEFKFMDYKILNMEEINLQVSIWSSREMVDFLQIVTTATRCSFSKQETSLKLKQLLTRFSQ